MFSAEGEHDGLYWKTADNEPLSPIGPLLADASDEGYTRKAGAPFQGYSVTIALERPGASGDQSIYADRIELSNIKPRFNFPDLSGNIRIDRDWGHLQFASIVRKIGWVDTSGNPINLGGSVVGWGVNLSSNLKVSKTNLATLRKLCAGG